MIDDFVKSRNSTSNGIPAKIGIQKKQGVNQYRTAAFAWVTAFYEVVMITDRG
jgi:hypothetical protein